MPECSPRMTTGIDSNFFTSQTNIGVAAAVTPMLE
jgi:hypothetical protein